MFRIFKKSRVLWLKFSETLECVVKNIPCFDLSSRSTFYSTLALYQIGRETYHSENKFVNLHTRGTDEKEDKEAAVEEFAVRESPYK